MFSLRFAEQVVEPIRQICILGQKVVGCSSVETLYEMLKAVQQVSVFIWVYEMLKAVQQVSVFIWEGSQDKARVQWTVVQVLTSSESSELFPESFLFDENGRLLCTCFHLVLFSWRLPPSHLSRTTIVVVLVPSWAHFFAYSVWETLECLYVDILL